MGEQGGAYGDDFDAKSKVEWAVDIERTRLEESLALAHDEFLLETEDDPEYLDLMAEMDRIEEDLVAEAEPAIPADPASASPAQPKGLKARLAAKLTETAARLDPEAARGPASDPYPSISAHMGREQPRVDLSRARRQELFEQVSATGREKAEQIATAGRIVGVTAQGLGSAWARKARETVSGQLASAAEYTAPRRTELPGQEAPLSQRYQGNAPQDPGGQERGMSL